MSAGISVELRKIDSLRQNKILKERAVRIRSFNNVS